MWKKEITDTLRQTASVLSFLLVVPLMFGINQLRLENNLSFFSYAVWGILAVTLLLVFYLAWTMFASDDKDGAQEYLKSLPLTNRNIFWMKVIPRFVAALLFILVANWLVDKYWWTHGMSAVWTNSYADGHLASMFIVPAVAMIYGFLLGISGRRNPFLAIAFIIPVLYLLLSPGTRVQNSTLFFLYFHVMVPLGMMDLWFFNLLRVVSFIIAAVIPATLPLLVLIPVFKSWDAPSGRIRSHTILKRIAAPLMLIIFLYTVNNFHLL
jgi:hypothetical protein